MYPNTQTDHIHSEAYVLASVDYFIQDVCSGYCLDQEQFKAILKDLVSSFKPIYNANLFYCNTVLIFIEVVNIVDGIISQMSQADYNSIAYFDDIHVWHIVNYIQSFSGYVKQQLMNYQQRELKNQLSLLDYTSSLINHYARLLVVRVDLSILQAHQSLYDIHSFNNALDTLLRRIADQDTCFNGLQGYVWALEHGASKGYHCHLLLMYDGNIHRGDFEMGQWIGECWEQITHGCGYIFNCNHSDYKSIYEAMGKLGIGMIHRTNAREVYNFLNYVAPYLVNGEKEQQHPRVKDKSNMRSFGKGVFDSKNRRGL
jgi:hypothetical protein